MVVALVAVAVAVAVAGHTNHWIGSCWLLRLSPKKLGFGVAFRDTAGLQFGASKVNKTRIQQPDVVRVLIQQMIVQFGLKASRTPLVTSASMPKP